MTQKIQEQAEIQERYRRLAIGIVTTAIEEYRVHLRASKKKPEDVDISAELDLLEAFFRSFAYRMFTNYMFDGERLIREIKEQEQVI